METITDNLVEDFMNRHGCKYDISEADNKLIEANTELSDENRLLKEELKRVYKRIDKAIEYVEKFIPVDTDTILIRERQRDYLLNILQGSDKE